MPDAESLLSIWTAFSCCSDPTTLSSRFCPPPPEPCPAPPPWSVQVAVGSAPGRWAGSHAPGRCSGARCGRALQQLGAFCGISPLLPFKSLPASQVPLRFALQRKETSFRYQTPKVLATVNSCPAVCQSNPTKGASWSSLVTSHESYLQGPHSHQSPQPPFLLPTAAS